MFSWLCCSYMAVRSPHSYLEGERIKKLRMGEGIRDKM